MRDDITLGEVKARCEEMTGKYGDDCCKHCDFGKMGCCNAPDAWKLEAAEWRVDWKLTYESAEEEIRSLRMKLEDADRMAEENARLRLIVGAVETMLGRKFDVS